jgi:hypothetical protein
MLATENKTRATDTVERDIVAVKFYGSRRHGPESLIEDAVLNRANSFFYARNRLMCVLGSRQIGNGLPDLTVISCRPRVRSLPELSSDQALLLGYLRIVDRATPGTLSRKLQIPAPRVERSLELLAANAMVDISKFSYRLRRSWQDVLDVATVEAKNTDWKRAIAQAARNTVFAHQSYVALPERQASAAIDDSNRKRLGIGVISVNADGAAEIRVQAHTRRPLLWKYYFELASEAAKSLQRGMACRTL